MAGENLVRPKGLKAKLENFWYHYKYHSIAVMVAFVTLMVSVIQCSNKTDYDYTIVVATRSMTLSTLQINAITTELTKYGEDLNGNGEVDLLLVDCTVDGNTSDYQTLIAKQQKLQMLLISEPEAMLFLMDSKGLEWVENLNPETNFIENTGLPDNGGKGFIISDTHIIQTPKANATYEKNLRWPNDLSICRRRVEGTALEKEKGAKENKNNADEFIGRIVKNNTK